MNLIAKKLQKNYVCGSAGIVSMNSVKNGEHAFFLLAIKFTIYHVEVSLAHKLKMVTLLTVRVNTNN